MNDRWEALFDELADLPAAERARRLAELHDEDPRQAAFLAGLLNADAAGTHALAGPVAERAPELVAAAFDTALARTGERVGRYRLVSILGRGGMAEVWLAERADGEFEQRVALKLVRSEIGSEEFFQRFLRERQILARLDHPGIARLLDGGRSERGEPYIVLELIDGTPIQEWCREHEASIEERIRLLIEVALAVDYAHRNFVVHRDLKPSNILVGRDGHAKLLDFGIAKLLGLDDGDTAIPSPLLTRIGSVALTPAYAAPEQILGEPVTTATDVYALGALLYELLTGRVPHPERGNRLAELVRAVELETLEAPSACLRRELATAAGSALARRRAHRLEGDLDTILLKALHREPARRYPSAAAFAEDLQRHLDGRPVLARADSFGYRASRFVRRHRLAVAGSVLLAATVLVGLGMTLWQARVARAQARKAETVRAFLESLFESNDPSQALGTPITVQSVLEEGVRRVDVELAAEPALQAEMLDLLARLQRKMGRSPEAQPLAERSLALRERLFGPASLEVAQARTLLGWVLYDQGMAREGKPLLEAGIEGLKAHLGMRHLDIPDNLVALVAVTFRVDGAAAALPLAQERAELYRRWHGENEELVATAISELGPIYFELNRYRDAEAANRESATIFARILPPMHPHHYAPNLNLGRLLVEEKRFAEARAPLMKALEVARTTFSPEHPRTARAHLNLAQMYRGLGEIDAGLEAAEEAFRISHGRDAFSAAHAQMLIGTLHARAGRWAEAAAHYDDAVARFTEIAGDEHPAVLTSRAHRGLALLHLDHRAEGLEAMASSLAAFEALGAAGERSASWIALALGEERRRDGQLEDALALHQKARALYVKGPGEDSIDVATCDYQIALDLLAMDLRTGPEMNREEAKRRLENARELLRRLEPTGEVLRAVETELAR